MSRKTIAAVVLIASMISIRAAGDEARSGDEPTDGCDHIAVQPGQDPSELPELRKGCLRDEAFILLGHYFWAARERVFAGFGDQDSDLRIAATQMKDVPRRGPESREYLLRIYEYTSTGEGSADDKSVGLVARLRRVRGDAVQVQIVDLLESRYGFSAKVDRLSSLKQPQFLAALKAALPPDKEVVDAIALDELVTDKVACPALAARMDALFDMEIPRPRSIHVRPGESSIERIVIHPTVVEVRIADWPVSVTVADSSMSTGPYRWLTETMRMLEPCWRPAQR